MTDSAILCGNVKSYVVMQYQYKPNRDLVEFVREAAFAGFRDPESRWHGRGRSLFGYDLKGVSLSNPMFPEVEGKNLYDSFDIYGKKPVMDRASARSFPTSSILPSFHHDLAFQ